MALWLVRGGRHGQHEDRFFQTDRVYGTWPELADVDVSKLDGPGAVARELRKSFEDAPENRLLNWARQVWALVSHMAPGDWVVVPRKGKSLLAFGEVVGPYEYDPKEPDTSYRHFRKVKWLNREVARSVFGQDLLYSLGAFMTICRIKRNDAEKRVRAVAESGWQPEPAVSGKVKIGTTSDDDSEGESVDLELLARDEIAKLIQRKFKGHNMAVLAQAILEAQGYTTFRSPPGPDKGVDILAAPGPLGFGQPRICVQVKSGDASVDRPTLDQLIGTMQNVQADQGLLVAWGGFKSSVDKETAHHFFRVRLWDRDALIDELLEHYDKLDEDLRAELPLKRIWSVAAQEEEG